MDQEPARPTVICHRCHQPQNNPNSGDFIPVIPSSHEIPAAPHAHLGEQLLFSRTPLEKPLRHLTSFALTMMKVAISQRPGMRTSTRTDSTSVQEQMPWSSLHPQSRWISPHFSRGAKRTARIPPSAAAGFCWGSKGKLSHGWSLAA